MAVKESMAFVWKALVVKEVTITTMAGTPIFTVSLSAGSEKSTFQWIRTPCLRMGGICRATCTSTPSGLPMARMSKASVGLVLASRP